MVRGMVILIIIHILIPLPMAMGPYVHQFLRLLSFRSFILLAPTGVLYAIFQVQYLGRSECMYLVCVCICCVYDCVYDFGI